MARKPVPVEVQVLREFCGWIGCSPEVATNLESANRRRRRWAVSQLTIHLEELLERLFPAEEELRRLAQRMHGRLVGNGHPAAGTR